MIFSLNTLPRHPSSLQEACPAGPLTTKFVVPYSTFLSPLICDAVLNSAAAGVHAAPRSRTREAETSPGRPLETRLSDPNIMATGFDGA